MSSNKNASLTEPLFAHHSVWSSIARSIVALIMTTILSMYQASSEDDENEPALQNLLNRFSQDANNFMVSLNQFCRAADLSATNSRSKKLQAELLAGFADGSFRLLNKEVELASLYYDEEKNSMPLCRKAVNMEKATQVCMAETFPKKSSTNVVKVLTVEGYSQQTAKDQGVQTGVNAVGVDVQDDATDTSYSYEELDDNQTTLEKQNMVVPEEVTTPVNPLSEFQKLLQVLGNELQLRTRLGGISSSETKVESPLGTIAKTTIDLQKTSKGYTGDRVKTHTKSFNPTKEFSHCELKSKTEAALKKESPNKNWKKLISKHVSFESASKSNCSLAKTKEQLVVGKRYSLSTIAKEPSTSSSTKVRCVGARKDVGRTKTLQKSEERLPGHKTNFFNITKESSLSPSFRRATRNNLFKSEELLSLRDRSLSPAEERKKFSWMKQKESAGKGERGCKSASGPKRKDSPNEEPSVHAFFSPTNLLCMIESEPTDFTYFGTVPEDEKNSEGVSEDLNDTTAKSTADVSIATSNPIIGLLTGLEDSQLDLWTKRLAVTEHTLEKLRTQITSISGVLSSDCSASLSRANVKDQSSQSDAAENKIRMTPEKPCYPVSQLPRCKIPRRCSQERKPEEHVPASPEEPSLSETSAPLPKYTFLVPKRRPSSPACEETCPFRANSSVAHVCEGCDCKMRSSRTRTRNYKSDLVS